MTSGKMINLIAANMGYGHQRAAYPLLSLGANQIITINDYPEMEDWERKYWLNSLRSYEQISRFKKIPLIGKFVFSIMDSFQEIEPFYPFRNLSKQSVQQKFFYNLVKKGLGKKLISTLSVESLPIVTTFFPVAYAAEYNNYGGDIYCIVCDTDIARAWAPINPGISRIKYFAPNEQVKERLLMYGVKNNNIIETGFPLPKDNIGFQKEVLLKDLEKRIKTLDPLGKFKKEYESIFNSKVTSRESGEERPITISYAVGGAGAQKEIGVVILNKLANEIKNKKIKLNLIAGNRLEVKEFFDQEIDKLKLKGSLGVSIIYAEDKYEYFRIFNLCLRSTDILWTKPSELSFYCALGIPIIISETVGSQEDFNRDWLLSVGAGINSLEVEYVEEWLSDLIESGRLVRAAIDGFLNAEQMGAYNIEKIILKK